MSRYTGPKRRLSRRCGVHLWGKQKIGRKRKVPGAHGKTGQANKEQSLFGNLLNEKRIYACGNGCLRFRYLCNTMKEARKSKWVKIFGNTVDAFGSLIEMRLDIFVYRVGLSPTIMGSHQLVSHKHIMVDNRVVNIRSFRLRPGMVVSVSPNTSSLRLVERLGVVDNNNLPGYIDTDGSGGYFFKDEPRVHNIDYGYEFNLSKVCEYLSMFA